MPDIDWIPPEPRKGLLGAWDKFVGPGATASEEIVQLAGGLALTVALIAVMVSKREALNWTGVQFAVAALLAFDLAGGIVTNATSAAKRWYHRPGHNGPRAHLPFIAIHGVHLLVVAALFRGMDWAFFAGMFAFLLAAALVISSVPLHIQRPVGFLLFCCAFLLGSAVYMPTTGLEWFVPFFYFKLLVSHLIKEAPFAP